MGGLALFAKEVGAPSGALNTLLTVALLMCLWNPLYIWDVGFQLSFFATLGLILYADPFSQFANRVITKYFPASAAEKFAKLFQSSCCSRSLHRSRRSRSWHIISSGSHWFQFLANPFILPAQPAVMILGGLAVLLSLVWFPLGQIAAWVTWPFVIHDHHSGDI